MSESEQLMRDAPSVRYDPRFNVKCLLGGIDNAGIPRLSRGNADPKSNECILYRFTKRRSFCRVVVCFG